MSVESYLPILIQLVLAVSIAVTIIVASHIFGQRGQKNSIKDSPYECGMLPLDGNAGTRFSVKFYVTAMLFILFDIEVVFMIPWALAYKDILSSNLPIVMPIFFFIFLLGFGLIYEWRKGALEWEK